MASSGKNPIVRTAAARVPDDVVLSAVNAMTFAPLAKDATLHAPKSKGLLQTLQQTRLKGRFLNRRHVLAITGDERHTFRLGTNDG